MIEMEREKIQRREGHKRVLIAFAMFIVLGMPGGLLGVIWPDMRDSFGLSQDDLGVLLLASTVGHILAGVNNGRLMAKYGIFALFLGSTLLTTVALWGYAAAPAWLMIILLGTLLGAGGGVIDATGNTYIAQYHGARTMNWLHASFGIGATLSPFMFSVILAVGYGWRAGYAIIGILQLGIAAAIWWTRREWRGLALDAAEAETAEQSSGPTVAQSLRLPIVWLMVVLFFLYGGFEITPANWSFTFYTEGRNVPETTALQWSGIYWGVFTVGRILMGFLVSWIGGVRLLRLCVWGGLIGSLLLWQNFSPLLSFFGLALIGFAIAPIFPTLISMTPRLVGGKHAPNAIGFQVGAAGVGIALVPALAGYLIEAIDLEILGPFLVVTAVVLIGLNEWVIRMGKMRQPS